MSGHGLTGGFCEDSHGISCATVGLHMSNYMHQLRYTRLRNSLAKQCITKGLKTVHYIVRGTSLQIPLQVNKHLFAHTCKHECSTRLPGCTFVFLYRFVHRIQLSSVSTQTRTTTVYACMRYSMHCTCVRRLLPSMEIHACIHD